VTSVLQTTAGKMIFGKCDERASARADLRPPMSAASVQVGETKKQIVAVDQPAE
jgi:hypothetical protein